ncbi:MAG: hypothetical protein H6Q59_1644 [Firmicutes bacterium]|nr:hypothetical protein [Bacillota bacterium]
MYPFLRKHIPSFLIVLCLSLLFGGCSFQTNQKKQQSRFDEFMNNLFVNEVQADSLSLNYSLAKPENYGIHQAKATFGEYSIDHMKEEHMVSENELSHLQDFDYDLLTKEQKLTYEIVEKYLETDLSLGKYNYYYECLGPTTGIQAQLPILLAEYSFYKKKDINEYLRLLPLVHDYFSEIIQFEREKSAQGLFMSDAVADRIIAQCESFITDPENNFLITYFNEKISAYTNLSKTEKAEYKAANQEIVLTHVIPAYKLLIDALQELKGTGTNKAGLYYYPEGREYYECLTKYKTGSDKSMEEMINLLETAIGDGIVDITSLTLSDKKIIDKYLAFSSFPITNPEDILTDLKSDITKDFPQAEPVSCNIKYVPPSLANYLSPAMYLVPPIDNYRNNDIYINGNDDKTLSMIYTTVAHEGYPGHMYQCVYFRSQNPAPIRSILNFMGYDEGWATYVEMYSYRYAGIDSNLADFLRANNIVILCMYARADIGIHYEGWSKKTTMKYVMNFIGDAGIAELIYNTLLEEPAIYLPYAVGYLEIQELRNKAESTLGDQFDAKEFHQFILDTGPAQFGIIDDYMEVWMNNLSVKR